MLKSITPNPRTWTLRFKNGRTTVLVEVDPLQTLADVRVELLKAIHLTHPDGTLNGQTIPQNPDDIKLAKPIATDSIDEGFVTLESAADMADELSGKGKGKMAVSTTKSSAIKSCPQAAGLRDGDMVAFKFKSEDDGGDQEEDEFAIEQEKWNVVLPSMEDGQDDEEPQPAGRSKQGGGAGSDGADG